MVIFLRRPFHETHVECRYIVDYAEQMLEVLEASPAWTGGVIERPEWRPVTKYESIALEAGRPIADLMYTRR